MDDIQQLIEDFHDLQVPDALEYYLGLNDKAEKIGSDEEEESEPEDEESKEDTKEDQEDGEKDCK